MRCAVCGVRACGSAAEVEVKAEAEGDTTGAAELSSLFSSQSGPGRGSCRDERCSEYGAA